VLRKDSIRCVMGNYSSASMGANFIFAYALDIRVHEWISPLLPVWWFIISQSYTPTMRCTEAWRLSVVR
jgi:hypothetical protein